MRIKMFCNDPPSLYPSTFIDYSNLRLQIQSTTNEINCNMLSMLQTSVPYYRLNEECVNAYGKPKKKLTIYDLNQLIFPFDPIRDWVEKKTKEINKKYAWAEAL